jgi:hypothetical protein
VSGDVVVDLIFAARFVDGEGRFALDSSHLHDDLGSFVEEVKKPEIEGVYLLAAVREGLCGVLGHRI